MAKCASCKTEFEEDPNERMPCPKCGATGRIVELVATAYGSSWATARLEVIPANAVPLSFGAIVTYERSVLEGQVITLVEPVYREVIRRLHSDPQFAVNISPRQWEEIVAAVYDKAGFDEVILTPRSSDLGRDVIAIKRGFGAVRFIEQVKAYNPGHVVKADEVRALLGVLSADLNATKAIFTTTSSFAPRLAEDALIRQFLPYRLELVDRDKLYERLIRSL